MASGLTNFISKRLQDLHNNAQAVIKPVQRTVIAPVVHAVGNLEHAGGNTVNGIATGARDTGGAIAATNRFLKTPGLGVQRSLIGAGQGASGLYDLATPGTGTSRLSKYLQTKAVSTDRQGAAAEHPLLYKPGQLIGDTAQFVAGGELADAAKSLPAIARFGKAIPKVINPVTKVADNLATHGAGGRIAGAIVRGVGEGRNLASNALMTASQTGQNASKGRKTTPLGVVSNLAEGTVLSGLGAGGAQVTKETVGPLINKATQALKDAHLARPSNLNDSEVVHLNNFLQARGTNAMTQDVYDKGVAAAQKAGVDINNPKQVDDLIGAHMHHATVVSQRIQALSDLKNQALQFSQDHPLGLTSGAVDGEGNRLGLDNKPLNKKVVSRNPDGTIPTNPLARSTKADAPTAISDALVAKNEKLQAARSRAATATPAEIVPTADPAALLGNRTAAIHQDLADKLTKTNRFTKGAQDQRQNLSEPVTEAVQGEHQVRNTKQLQDEAVAAADAGGIDKTIADAHKALQAPIGKIGDKDVALAQQAIERADAAGRTEDAVNLHDQLSEHLTKQGQSIQAASLFYKLSPQGQLYKAMRDIKKGGGELTPELEAKLRQQVEDIKNGANPKVDAQIAKVEGEMDKLNAKEGGVTPADEAQMQKLSDQRDRLVSKKEGGKEEATNLARAKFQKTVREAIPQGKLNGILSVWKAGLLSGVKTQTGNLLSNGTFAALKKISDLPAAGLDAVLSKFTGKRTKTFTLRGSASGAVEGTRKGIGTLRTGIDSRDIGNGGKLDVHGELNFKNPVIQKVFGRPSNLVFRGMNAADQPFFFSAVKNNLHDMALADAKTRGLKGAEADAFVKNQVANPTPKMAEQAKLAAQKAVLGQDSKLAASLSHLAQEHPTVQVIAPFIKVPTNFLTRTLDFTPVGYIKSAVKAMGDAKHGRGFDQRAFVEAVGEATTGSAILYLGAEMANHKLLSGAYPTDPKEQGRWKTEGITPNSIHIADGSKNGRWISMNYLGPLGLLLNAGKSYHDAAAQGNSGWTQALGSFGQNLAGQSFLSGFSSFANALNDPSRYLSNLKNSEAGSLVPSWANDLAGLLDNKQRNATTAPQTIQSRIPGARNGLPIKTDTYGNELPQRTNVVQLTVDPTRPSNDLQKNNPVVQEVARLHNTDPNNKDLQVTPTAPTSINIEGKTVKLNANQKYALNNKVGQAVQKRWGDLIKTPGYKALDDAGKAKALSGLRGDVTTLIERQYVLDNNLGVYNKSPARAVQALGEGSADLTSYVTKTPNSGSTGVTVAKTLPMNSKQTLTKYNAMSTDQRNKASYGDNSFDYKVAQAKYDNNVANGNLSKAGLIKAQASLAKEKVGTSYSRDVRDLYNLSNDEVSQYLATSDPGVDKASIAKQILAYGDALASAGVATKNKFRTTNGAVTLGKTSKSGSGSKFKTAAIPSIKSNPYKTAGVRKTFKQIRLPSIKSTAKHASYKTAKLTTNINAKLRKA